LKNKSQSRSLKDNVHSFVSAIKIKNRNFGESSVHAVHLKKATNDKKEQNKKNR
jgi:hypothetical protein